MRIFVDSDVIISSLLSSRGAAYILINTSDITRTISTSSLQELHIVCNRLHIPKSRLDALIEKKITVLSLRKKTKDYQAYVTDPHDAHIIEGAVAAKTSYLVSYNLKHFKSNRIKEKFGILVMTPALFLQYLRSH